MNYIQLYALAEALRELSTWLITSPIQNMSLTGRSHDLSSSIIVTWSTCHVNDIWYKWCDDSNCVMSKTWQQLRGKISPETFLKFRKRWHHQMKHSYIPESQDYCEVNPRFNLWVGLGKALVSYGFIATQMAVFKRTSLLQNHLIFRIHCAVFKVLLEWKNFNVTLTMTNRVNRPNVNIFVFLKGGMETCLPAL